MGGSTACFSLFLRLNVNACTLYILPLQLCKTADAGLEFPRRHAAYKVGFGALDGLRCLDCGSFLELVFDHSC